MARFRRLQLSACWLLLHTVALFCSSIELGHGPRLYGGALQNESEATGNVSYTNASDLLSSLLKEYDIRLRPGFGGEALVLTMDMIIASFDSMSEVNMDYTVTMYLHQYWRDERLSWSSVRNVEDMTLSGDFSTNIWVPDTFLANDKHSFLHDVTETNKMLRLHSDGRVAYGMRFTSTLACHMDLRNYPLDAQNCTVEIESYGYTTSEVLMKWNHPDPVRGVAEADVPQFTIMGFHTEDSIVKTATGHYQRLSLVFQLQRSIGYFIFQTYLPCILIVMLSWVSFWINHEATSARVALGITTVLTMTTISTGVRQSLPRISYVKSIDIYLVMCFVFVFAALLEYAAVNYSYWGDRARKKAREKKAAQHTNPAQLEMLPATADDSEGAVNLYREWGVPNTFMEEQREPNPEAIGIYDPIAEQPSPPPPSRPTTTAVEKRPSSPLPSLFHSGSTNHVSSAQSASTGVAFEGCDDANANEFPEYPRVQSAYGRPLPQASNARLRQRGTNASRAKRAFLPSRRAAGLKQSLHTIRRKARSVIPRIRDINVIDKYSRVVFPASFILFNAFYWTYYTMMQ